MLKTLSPREEKIIRLRFGLEDGSEHTLEEVGQNFAVTRETNPADRSQGAAEAAASEPQLPAEDVSRRDVAKTRAVEARAAYFFLSRFSFNRRRKIEPVLRHVGVVRDVAKTSCTMF